MCPLDDICLVKQYGASHSRAGHTRTYGGVCPSAPEPVWCLAAPPHAQCGRRHYGGAVVCGPQPHGCQPCAALSHSAAGCVLATPTAGAQSHLMRGAWRPRLQRLQCWSWPPAKRRRPTPSARLHLSGVPCFAEPAQVSPHPRPAHHPTPRHAPARRPCARTGFAARPQPE